MALDYHTEYPGQVATDANYPYGKARNQLVLNDGIGTPWEERLVNDIFGFHQAILLRANIEPSGVADSATVSQLLLSLLVVVHQEHGLLNWESVLGSGTGGDFVDGGASAIELRGGGYDPVYQVWLLAGDTDGCNVSTDDGGHFVPHDTDMGSTVALEDLALVGQSSNHSAVAVGNSSTAYRRADIAAGSWSTVTITGADNLFAVVFDSTNDRYVTVGEDSSNEPFAAISDDNAGAAWTDVSASLPASFAGMTLNGLATSGGIVVAAASTAHTKLAVSTDGGATWADSTTSLTSGVYAVTHSYNLGLFVAVRIDSTANNYVYTSEDGDTWTLMYSASLGLNSSVGAEQAGKSVAAYGRAIIVAGKISDGAVINDGGAIAYSTDGGATWRTQRVGITPVSALISDPLALRTIAPLGNDGGVRTPRIRGL